ncbi:DHHC palmitoyltransferase [Ceratobasidium sp. AG-Ba]|nr:DHHC palmitoyltransferase [Ceratobasidium sp. AG-Ba]
MGWYPNAIEGTVPVESNLLAHIIALCVEPAVWNGITIVPGCLTVQQHKAFLALLSIAGAGIWLMALPIIRPTLDGAYEMYLVSRNDPTCSRIWWDWWGSYLVFGGPGGRWVLGTALGYWVAKHEPPSNPQRCHFGLLFMRPNFSAAVTLATALSLAGFCLVLAIQMAFRLLRGQTTIEALQSQSYTKTNDLRRYLWVPLPLLASPPATDHATQQGTSSESLRHRAREPLQGSGNATGIAFSIPWNERIYDLGTWRNAKRFWAIPIFGLKHRTSMLGEPPIISTRLIRQISEDHKDD